MVTTVINSILICPDIATTYPHYTVIGTQIPPNRSLHFFPFTEHAVRLDASIPAKSSTST